jgi:hypothetical protein
MKHSILALSFGLLLVGCRTEAQDTPPAPENLGVLSPETIIPLERNTKRGDFSHFVVEAAPLDSASSVDLVNPLRFSTTNNFLRASDFTGLPSGQTLLGLKGVLSSGTSSSVRLYRFDLQLSERISAPIAKQVQLDLSGLENKRSDSLIPDGGEGDTLVRAFYRLRSSSSTNVVHPPLPPGATGYADVFIRFNTNDVSNRLPPLPGGTNETYFEGMQRRVDSTKRRNE